MALLGGFLDESGLFYFKKLGLEFSHDTLSYKSLLTIANNIVVCSVLYDNVDVNVVAENKMSSWHARLGHANPKAMNSVLQLCKVHLNNKDSHMVLNSCCLGKSLSYPYFGPEIFSNQSFICISPHDPFIWS